jgi:hypothetical protein
MRAVRQEAGNPGLWSIGLIVLATPRDVRVMVRKAGAFAGA